MTDHFLKEEQEVIIHFNPVEETAKLYTAYPAWIRRMDSFVQYNPEQFKCTKVDRYQDGTICSKEYEFPKRFITVRRKDVQRNLTDEEKKTMAARMRKTDSAPRNTAS